MRSAWQSPTEAHAVTAGARIDEVTLGAVAIAGRVAGNAARGRAMVNRQVLDATWFVGFVSPFRVSRKPFPARREHGAMNKENYHIIVSRATLTACRSRAGAPGGRAQ